MKKLDQELHKFKLELEADNAGITSKLEQVISSKNIAQTASSTSHHHHHSSSTSLSSSSSALANTISGININLNQHLNHGLNDDSDFTLCTPNNGNNYSTNSHKRKHSNVYSNSYANSSSNSSVNLMMNNLLSQNDEDSSLSWNSARMDPYNPTNSNMLNSNPVFHYSNNQKKTSQAGLLNLMNTTTSSRRSSNQLRKKRTKLDGNKQQRMKKSRNNFDFEDDTYDDEEDEDEDEMDDNYTSEDKNDDIYQSENEETCDGLNEAGSEVASENGLIRHLNDDGLASSDEDEDVDNDDSNKMKLNNKQVGNRSHYVNNHRHIKDDWNSGEDTNERYCICKDISYGDMIMCDNRRVSLSLFQSEP